jgi:hypothetical protein
MAVTLNASTSSGLVQSADTSGELNLQSNGSTKLSVLSTGVSGTLIQGTAVASTSGTSIDFTGIPSWVKRITVLLQGVSTSGSSNLQVQLGTGATPTYTTSGYLGSCSGGGNGSSLVAANFTAGFGLTAATALTGLMNGGLTISNINGNTWVAFGTTGRSDSTNAYMIGGSVSLAAILTAVRITTANGTDAYDAGTINIQYEG